MLTQEFQKQRGSASQQLSQTINTLKKIQLYSQEGNIIMRDMNINFKKKTRQHVSDPLCATSLGYIQSIASAVQET